MQPTKSSGETFTILLKTATKAAKPKVVISKKVAQLAVDRNRIKRLFREALSSINFEGQAITVIVKKNIANYKKIQIVEDLKNLLRKNV